MAQSALLQRIRRPKAELPPEVYAALVESLYGPMASLVSGAIGGVLCAGIIAWATGSVLSGLSAGAIAVIGLFRVAIMVAYRNRDITKSELEAHKWERWYAYGAWSFSAFLGLFCVIAVLSLDNPGVHLLTAAVTIGYTAGISGRNAGRPALVIAQIVLATGPLAVALVVHGEFLYFALAFMLLLNFFSVAGIAKGIHRTLFKALFATRENRQLAAKFDTAINNMSHGLCMVDVEGRLLVANQKLIELLGLPTDTAPLGMSLDVLIAEAVKASTIDEQDAGILAARCKTILAHGADKDFTFTTKDGRVLSFTCEAMEDRGSVLVIEDITERRRAQAQIEHLAHFDVLTGLPNRATFSRECARVLDNLASYGGNAAVLSIDLDHFKQVNDTLGHPVGDRLLCAVAKQLEGMVRNTDMVARFGGDEFVILQHPVQSPEEAANLAHRIIESLTDTYKIEDQQVIIGATIGVAMAMRDGNTVDTLIKHSDLALYRAKSTSRGTMCFFEAEMDVKAQNRRLIELDLREAIENKGFELHYQPIVNLKTKRIVSCEALIRWNHPARGYVSPVDFIGIAEETGLIVQIGAWVLEEACRQAATWPADVRVAVNLSPVQFRFRGLVDTVQTALHKAGLPANRLELEITESVLMQDTDSTKSILDQLVDMGIRLSLDDFGTGFSSISYLQKFTFSKIKLDKSFIDDIDTNEQARAVVQGVAVMARPSKMSIVAEGIELTKQVGHLITGGCTEGQGYLFSRPQPAARITELLADPNPIQIAA